MLAVDGWAVTFGTARRGLGGLGLAQSPPRCTKGWLVGVYQMKQPTHQRPVYSTNLILFDVAL